NLVPMVHTV
nr:Chain P, 9-meric peptide from Tegument protein pp65 [Human betaherpesvirus 5]